MKKNILSSMVNLVAGAVSTGKGDIRQLFQLDELLHKDKERLEGNIQVFITSIDSILRDEFDSRFLFT